MDGMGQPSFFENNSLSYGHTPTVRLHRIMAGSAASVLVKTEGRNPGGSVKCRTGIALVRDGEKRGVLTPGQTTIVEPTSGNTGISLAMIGAALGYRVILTMPETMSIERRKILAALGAEILLTRGDDGMTGAVEKARELVTGDPKRFVMLQQFVNRAGADIHEHTTGPELWEQSGCHLDAIVAGVGTGGTLMGITRFLRSKNPKLLCVAVEPEESPVLTQTLAHKPVRPGPHGIQGIGAGFVPALVDMSLINRVETVHTNVATDFAKRLMREEGILAGLSAGAAVAAAERLAREKAFAGKTIGVILPDTGERYLSTALFA